MENNGERRVTVQESKAALQNLLPEDELNSRLTAAIASMQDALDSPKTQLILRNAVLMLLELPEHTSSVDMVYRLLTNAEFRSDAVKKLGEATPQYWSEDWNSLWRKDVDPLLSMSQQRIAKRNSLLTFWSAEWDEIPSEAKTHVAEMLKRMARDE